MEVDGKGRQDEAAGGGGTGSRDIYTHSLFNTGAALALWDLIPLAIKPDPSIKAANVIWWVS